MNPVMSASANQAPIDSSRPISVLICALGGEGGGVLADWLVDAAREAGFPAQATSIPGVAQRTGATTYFFEMLPVPMNRLNGRRPVFSLNAIPGALDAVVSSELLESARCASNGLPSPDRTVFISSTSRTFTTTERSVPGDGRLDSAALLSLIQAVSREHHVLDMQRIAQEEGTVVSAVMFGALAGSGVLPFDQNLCLTVIAQSGRGAEASQQGFNAAWRIVQQARAANAVIAAQLADAVNPSSLGTVLDMFPVALRDLLSLGVARLTEYQSTAYATRYLERMQRVVSAEQQSDTQALQSYQLSREMARWLALWMSYDDIARVASLKSRASRMERVRREVKADDSEVIAIYDHFKPGIAEIAAMLPPALATRLRDWDRQRLAEGKASWSMPVKLATHTVLGTLLLRCLAATRYLRPFSSRYADEQRLIDEWLSAVTEGAAQDWQLGFELGLCGRLIKGYGDTNDRGRDNVLHILRHIARHPVSAAERVAAIRRAREAALSDEAGSGLDRVLAEFGAPPRPIKVQPIHWVRRERTSTEST